MADITLECRAASDAEREITTAALRAHTENAVGAAVSHQPFGLLAHKGERLAGSVIGKIFFNWMHLDLVWVDEPFQRRKLGTQLMTLAIQFASQSRLTGIEVWTQSWQAPEFYRKLGFQQFAVLEDFLPGHTRIAFRYLLSGQP